MKLRKDYFSFNDFNRKATNLIVFFILLLFSACAIFVLGNIFFYVIQKGYSSLNLAFFTKLPAPVGETGGGFGNSILGSLELISIASLIGLPWGVLIGVYLSEYGSGKSGRIVRFASDILNSVPSIVIGIFVYALIVKPMKGFSALAGGISLSIILIPSVARMTEEILRLIPQHVREAGLALGLPRRKVILNILVRGSFSGLLTGIILSIARIMGETAPLLLTALNSRLWPQGVLQPISSIPVQIYTYAISPFENWRAQAWAGAFVLIAIVFAVNLSVRILSTRKI